jgi:S1-C subfamily serine protease
LAIVEVFPSTAATKLENLGGKRVRPEPGDRLISINGELLRDTQHFEQIVSGLDREAPVTVVLLDQRTGQELELSGQLDQGGGWRLGLRVNALAPDEVPVNGLPIVEIFRGTAATQLTDLQGNRVRLEIGDRLLAIDDQLVLDAKHFERTVARLPRGAEITLQIINRRDGQPLELLGRLDRGGGWRLGLRVNNP